MTKQEALTLLRINQAQMARIFGVSRAAVSQWPSDAPLPPKRLMQLKYELYPELFDTPEA
jgi:transcriptional regulator with XRE-family HTH domain